jgi:hypothetical protein
MSQALPSSIAGAAPNPPARNPAIQRCCDARDRSLEQSREQNLDDYHTRDRAEKAFQEALPDLTGYENIRDFIACISYGVFSGDIHQIAAPQHLYAAQVAISALRLEPKIKETKRIRRKNAKIPTPPFTASNLPMSNE